MSKNNKTPSNNPNIFTARYRNETIPEYKGNPLIEALPPIFSEQDWMVKLSELPEFNDCEREEEGYIRAYYIFRLTHFFQPLPRHTEIARKIEQMIRNGYVGRNPNTADRGMLLQKVYEESQTGKKLGTNYTQHHPISSASFIGSSGAGKSTTVERCLSTIPQVIYHPKSGIHQVTWLKLDCSHDGDIKELGLNFLLELDQILGTNLRDQYKSHVHEETLLDQVKKCAVTYSLGLLVIDEMQNLSVKKSDGQEKMLNYLQTLCNTLQVPILMMGTIKTLRLFEPSFRQARRSAALGADIWENLQNDETWKLLVESLWEYQWVRNPIALDKTMLDYLYDETQGIVALLITLFILAQLYAIRTKKEILSQDIFRSVVKKYMQPVQPMIKGLRSGDSRRISMYEDLSIVNFEDMLEQERESIRLEQFKPTARQANTMTTPKDDAMKILLEMGYSIPVAEQAVNDALQQGKTTKATIVKSALIILQPADPVDDAAPADGQDLRKADDSDALRNSGMIRGLPKAT